MGAPKGNKNALGNKGGRPTKYNSEIVKKALDYLETYQTKYKDEIPSIIGLALVLDISDETLQSWRKDKTKVEFSGILEAIARKQHQILIAKGLNGEFNPSIAKLVLGKHGYHDRQEIDQKNTYPAGLKVEYVLPSGKNR